MAVPNQLKNQHLLWRAGFGPAVEQLPDLSVFSPQQVYKAMVKASSKKPGYINIVSNELEGLMAGIQEAGRQQKMELSQEQRKNLQKQKQE